MIPKRWDNKKNGSVKILYGFKYPISTVILELKIFFPKQKFRVITNSIVIVTVVNCHKPNCFKLYSQLSNNSIGQNFQTHLTCAIQVVNRNCISRIFRENMTLTFFQLLWENTACLGLGPVSISKIINWASQWWFFYWFFWNPLLLRILVADYWGNLLHPE